jgi:hypothetical protein
MAGKVADQRIAVIGGKAADGIADAAQRLARRDLIHANLHRPPAIPAQTVKEWRSPAPRPRCPGVGEITSP